jgi:hypothetical protein
MLVDTGTHPIPVLGSKEGSGFAGSGTYSSAAALYITGLKENELYELAFFVTGALASGTPENVYIRPGGVVTTAPVTTASFLWPASKIPVIQVKLGGDQQSIGLLGTSTTSQTVFWRRLT